MRETFTEVGRFLWAVFWQWVSAVACGTITFTQVIYPKLTKSESFPNGKEFPVSSWWILGGCLAFAMFMAWREQYRKALLLKPRIKVHCGTETEGCIVPDHRGIWYRARLDLTRANVSELEASIVGLREDGEKVDLYGENLTASMCESEGKGQTTLIREGRPEYINLLFASEDAQKLPVLSLKNYPSSVKERVFLKLHHEYEMSVVLTCDNTHQSIRFRVKLKLRSNKDVEKFELI